VNITVSLERAGRKFRATANTKSKTISVSMDGRGLYRGYIEDYAPGDFHFYEGEFYDPSDPSEGINEQDLPELVLDAMAELEGLVVAKWPFPEVNPVDRPERRTFEFDWYWASRDGRHEVEYSVTVEVDVYAEGDIENPRVLRVEDHRKVLEDPSDWDAHFHDFLDDEDAVLQAVYDVQVREREYE